MYVLKKDGRPESAKHWKKKNMKESGLINCDLANPSTPIGGVHQRFLSPNRGVHKEKIYDTLLGVSP